MKTGTGEPRYWTYSYGDLQLFYTCAPIAERLDRATENISALVRANPGIHQIGSLLFGRTPVPPLEELRSHLAAARAYHPPRAHVPGTPLLVEGHITHPSGALR